jgi:hypothetical protein
MSSQKNERLKRVLRTVCKFSEENAVRNALENDASLAVKLVDGRLPGEAINDDETCAQSTEDDHHSAVG